VNKAMELKRLKERLEIIEEAHRQLLHEHGRLLGVIAGEKQKEKPNG